MIPSSEEIRFLYWNKGVNQRHQKNVDLTFNPNMAYILGVLKGDGYAMKSEKWRTHQNLRRMV